MCLIRHVRSLCSKNRNSAHCTPSITTVPQQGAVLSHMSCVAMLMLPLLSHSWSGQCHRGVWVSTESVRLPEEEQSRADGGRSSVLLGQPAVWRTGRRHDGGIESFAFHIPSSQVQQIHRHVFMSTT